MHLFSGQEKVPVSFPFHDLRYVQSPFACLPPMKSHLSFVARIVNVSSSVACRFQKYLSDFKL